MAGNRKRGVRGAPGTASGPRRGGLRDTFVHSHQKDTGPSNSSPASHFSLKEEARNTERHQSWKSDLKLRYAQVSFVTAATPASEKSADLLPQESSKPEPLAAKANAADTVPEQSMAGMSLTSHISVQSSKMTQEMSIQNHHGQGHGPKLECSNVADNQDIYFVDTVGSRPLVLTDLPPPVRPRPTSPSNSHSSDEVIVFGGRKRAQQLDRFKYTDPASTMGRKQHSLIHNGNTAVIDDRSWYEASEVQKSLHPENAVVVKRRAAMPASKGSTSRPRTRYMRSQKRHLDEEIMADYIANIADGDASNDVSSTMLKRRDLGGTESDAWQDEMEASSTEERLTRILGINSASASDDLHSLNDLSTSIGILGAIDHILSKRERPSGLQYLIVWEGYTVDDARWIPLSSLDMPGAEEQIRLFEVEERLVKEYPMGSEDSDEISDKDDMLRMELEEELDDLKDEEDLLERKKTRMTDEQIARLLSKQEELGLGSEELLLFDGDEDERMSEDMDVGLLRKQAVGYSNAYRQRKRRAQDVFASASSFAGVFDQDPYSGFDVMNQERSSLRRRKGRRGALPFELSDAELEGSLQSAWENDRTKKKIRKQEREELRAQGLLGKKNKLDMKAKYAEGMSIDEVKNEVREFLTSTKESLSLPPMDKKDRKLVHEMANTFALKSKSVGIGRSRFPVLYKTSRTLSWDEDEADEINGRLNERRFLPRMDKHNKRGPAPVRRGGGRRGGGVVAAAVSYRDGEVVGATAPELGIENKGRAMLEKMGWSTGTALGALNNKGIMQPVAHVVKTTKAGLG